MALANILPLDHDPPPPTTMATRLHITADTESGIEGFISIPRPSMPSSNDSFLSDETEAPLPLSMSTSAALPGDRNNMGMSASTTAAAAADTALPDESRQDGIPRGRNDTVQYLLDHDRWPEDPFYTATQHAEHGSSARAPTEPSAGGFVFVASDETDVEVAATGSWADQAAPRFQVLEVSDTELGPLIAPSPSPLFPSA